MSWIERTITVDVPLLIAYTQWTRFEDFPKFMSGVQEVRQLDHKRLHWHADVMGEKFDWYAEITQRIPGQLIAWRNLSGARDAGGVSLHALGSARTLVAMRVEFESTGPGVVPDSVLARTSMRVEGDLRRFKKFIERRDPVDGSRREAIQDAPFAQASAGF